MLIMAWLGWTFASVLLVCAVAEGLGLLGARRRVRTLNQTVRAQGAALKRRIGPSSSEHDQIMRTEVRRG